jgi:hypothetical protein
MVLAFGNLLDLAGLDRKDVRLLRHQDNRYPGHPTPYVMWRDDRPRFEAYQETQGIGDAADLRAPYWASFVGVPGKETLFVGIYSAELVGVLPADRPHPVTGGVETAGSCHLYRLELRSELADYQGRLWIEWGAGYRQWIQRGDRKPKPIVELRRVFAEDPFPGYAKLLLRLSDIETIPATWREALRATRGIYLMTCPRTREQYVGMASLAAGASMRRAAMAAMSRSRVATPATISFRSSKRLDCRRRSPIWPLSKSSGKISSKAAKWASTATDGKRAARTGKRGGQEN